MGIAGMISRDFIDKDIGYSGFYGWSPISPCLRYSEDEKKIARNWGLPTIEEISNIENVVFYDTGKSKTNCEGKTELVYKWRYITERRLNLLLGMRRELLSQGSVLSVQASISETERAHENVLKILSECTEAVYRQKEVDHSDDDFEQVFAGELLGRLLGYFKSVNDCNSAEEIIHDLKYLAAVVMQRRDSDGDYRCSDSAYIEFLKELELPYEEKECEECRIETIFTDFKFCMVCGRRL